MKIYEGWNPKIYGEEPSVMVIKAFLIKGRLVNANLYKPLCSIIYAHTEWLIEKIRDESSAKFTMDFIKTLQL